MGVGEVQSGYRRVGLMTNQKPSRSQITYDLHYLVLQIDVLIPITTPMLTDQTWLVSIVLLRGKKPRLHTSRQRV
jgi:hypothetical protein